jgi:hypothetical protein
MLIILRHGWVSTVKRHDGGPLLVSDVLKGIHQHLAVQLAPQDLYDFPRRPDLRLRVDLLDGRCFAGLKYLGGNQFLLNLIP